MGPANYDESQYEYLERSARAGAQRIRAVIEVWFSRYPDSEKNELKKCLRTSNDISFLSALFELYLHELLFLLGYSIEVHPQLEGTGTRPDFLITDSEGNSSYVEAVLVTGSNSDEQGAEKRINNILDTINKINSPEFLMKVTYFGNPAKLPSGRKLKNELEVWLDSLNVEEVNERSKKEGHQSLPEYLYQHDGLEVQIIAIPKSPAICSDPEFRPIGLLS